MVMRQHFSKSDLEEIGQVLSRSAEPRIPIFKCGSRWNKIWKRLLMILSFILFGCSIMLVILEHTFSTATKIYVFVGIICVLTLVIWNSIEKKIEPLNVAKRKYGQSFQVEMKEDVLIYKQMEYLYTNIKIVVGYKNFLFIKADRRWLIIKADEAEKEAILLKMNEKCPIRFVKKKEAFDLREL